MAETVMGDGAIERILFAIESYGYISLAMLSKLFNAPINEFNQHLKRLENFGILVSEKGGYIRIYKFNYKYPFLRELRALVKRSIKFLPEKEKQKYYNYNVNREKKLY
jgi:DNA-binding transcriptional ArsR family regulator